MSINISAYDTTACSGLQMSKIKDELIKAIMLGGLRKVEIRLESLGEVSTIWLVEGGNSSADNVPYFRQPYHLVTSEMNCFIVDVRGYGKWNAPQGMFHVTQSVDYAWQLKRAVLNQYMLEGRIEVLRDLSPLPMAAYAELIAQSVQRRFALDPAEQMKVAALAAYFYMGLFTDESRFSEHDMPMIVGKIAKTINVPVDIVSSMIKDLDVLHSLDDFCQIIHQRLENVALQNFNIGTLLSIVGGTWFGSNARETLAVGLEHIPTWLNIVDSSLSSAVYRRSTLSKIIQRLDRRDAGKALHQSIEALIGGGNAVTIDGKTIDAYVEHF